MTEHHHAPHAATTPIDAVGKTAFITAQWRLEESRRPGRLFDDALAACFLDDTTEQLAARLGALLPEAPRLIVLRTRHIDDCLTERVRRFAQVVVLGAGFDTRRLRCDTGDVAWFEVDRAAVLDFKRARLRRHGLEPSTVYLDCDYVADDFVEHLIARGLDPARPTYVIWEGNTFFLPLDDVVLVLLRLSRRLRSFEISFDAMSDRVVSRSTGDPRVTAFAETYASLGAGFVTGLADVGSFARDLGLEIADHRAASDVERLHRVTATPAGGAGQAGALGGAGLRAAAVEVDRTRAVPPTIAARSRESAIVPPPQLFEHYFLTTLRWTAP